ncbi:MAG: 50S ribosomal protein L22 [Nanoarchaeota archaeon]|nr:50S ribosomal protein L22 [Nanoarchaeota archaeon]
MVQKYSFQNFDKETMARACGQNLQISLKKTVETAKAIQGKKVSTVIAFLEKVMEQKAVVPYTKFRAEMPHKKGAGIAAGAYPVFVARDLLKLVKSAQKNASEQEISGELYLLSVSGRKGSARYHYGRYSGRKIKSTNVEVIVGVKKK